MYPPGTSKRVSNNLIFLRKKGIDQSCNLTLRNNENQTYNNNNDEEVKQESHLLKCLNILFGTLKPTLHKEFSLELMQVFNWRLLVTWPRFHVQRLGNSPLIFVFLEPLLYSGSLKSKLLPLICLLKLNIGFSPLLLVRFSGSLIIRDLHIQLTATTILYSDNQVACHIVFNLTFHEKTKYVDIDYHVVHENLNA